MVLDKVTVPLKRTKCVWVGESMCFVDSRLLDRGPGWFDCLHTPGNVSITTIFYSVSAISTKARAQGWKKHSARSEKGAQKLNA